MDVMAKGDKWVRTGDLIVRDWRGWICESTRATEVDDS